MTEEINNLNTDLKELFVDSKYDRMQEILDKIADSIMIEITQYNFDIIKKYYEAERYTILAQFIKFVAYTSFLCEYSAKREIISSEEYDGMVKIFNDIYLMIKKKVNNLYTIFYKKMYLLINRRYIFLFHFITKILI